MSIARRTSHGVPQYNDSDEFLGPDGEVLVQTLSTGDAPIPSPASRTVTYRSRKATR